MARDIDGKDLLFFPQHLDVYVAKFVGPLSASRDTKGVPMSEKKDVLFKGYLRFAMHNPAIHPQRRLRGKSNRFRLPFSVKR